MLNKLGLSHSADIKLNNSRNYLKNFPAGMIISGNIITGDYNKLLFNTIEGQFSFKPTIDFNNGDQLTIQITQEYNLAVAQIITINDELAEGTLIELVGINNYDNHKQNDIEPSDFEQIDSEDIINIRPYHSTKIGSAIKFNVINLDSNKLGRSIDELLALTNILSEPNSEQIDSFASYFTHNIALKQLTMLIDKLKKISDNSLLQGTLISIDSGVNHINNIVIENDQLALRMRLSNVHNEQIMLTDYATFKAQLPIPVNEKFVTITIGLVDIINDEYEDNISHLDDLSKFFQSNFHWLNFENLISNDDQSLEKLLIIEELSIVKLDENMLVNMLKYIQQLLDGTLIETIKNLNIAVDQQQNIQLLIKDLNNIRDVNEYLLNNSVNAWQFMIIPVLHNQTINYLKIFTRQELSQPSNKRFVIEIFTNLIGPLQLDGLLINDTLSKKLKQFNLIIRTHKALLAVDSTMIEAIFKSNQQLFDINGFIKFEQAMQFSINPANDILNMLLVKDGKLI